MSEPHTKDDDKPGSRLSERDQTEVACEAIQNMMKICEQQQGLNPTFVAKGLLVAVISTFAAAEDGAAWLEETARLLRERQAKMQQQELKPN